MVMQFHRYGPIDHRTTRLHRSQSTVDDYPHLRCRMYHHHHLGMVVRSSTIALASHRFGLLYCHLWLHRAAFYPETKVPGYFIWFLVPCGHGTVLPFHWYCNVDW